MPFFINTFVVLSILLAGEVNYRKTKEREDPFIETDERMTLEEFKKRISEGERLVILDEYVLDVSQFCYNHPGGRFAIEHNVGRDISKFFYGCQSLENNAKEGATSGQIHSNYARIIVNQIIIAKLDNGQEGGVMTTQC